MRAVPLALDDRGVLHDGGAFVDHYGTIHFGRTEEKMKVRRNLESYDAFFTGH